MDDVASPGTKCLNCGAPLAGQYCGQCGQRATSRLISVVELLRDAFGDLFELDSRLWRTLLPLLAKPGQLTLDYLEGRRARYMPPFRMYLVFSLVFFLVAFFDPKDDLAILFEDDPTASSEPDEATDATRRKEAQEALDKLISDGVLDESMVGPGRLIDLGPEKLAEPDPDAAEPAEDSATTSSQGINLNVTMPDEAASAADSRSDGLQVNLFDDVGFDCRDNSVSVESAPVWVQKRLTKPRVKRLCERWRLEGEQGIGAAMLDKIPAALLLLLPFMALVMKLLYPLSRRYYVEHLLFFVHFHAFWFLLLTLQVLWSRLITWIGLNQAIAVLPIIATSFYAAVYLYLSMRRVYGQGRILTFLKFIILNIIYSVGFAVVLLGALLLAAFAL